MEPVTVTEKRIKNFLDKFGNEELIRYLEKYDTLSNADDYKIFLMSKQLASEAFDVPIAEIDGGFSGHEHVDARRITVYLTFRNTKIGRPGLSEFLNVSKRTIDNYLLDVKMWLNNPKVRSDFYEKYVEIEKKFNEWIQAQRI